MKIINPSDSERCRIAEEILCSHELKPVGIGRIILLPVPSFRDGEHVSGTKLHVSALMAEIASGDLLVGYKIPSALYSHAREKDALILDLERDSGFIFRNNELTAHATLGYLLSDRGFDLSEKKIGVIGYGSLGSALVRQLLFLGAEVVVFSGSAEKREALAREGISALGYEEIARHGTDVLINTAPACFLSDLSPDTERFIDLASGNHNAHFGAVSLPSLPERHYPKSAGRAYAKAVIDYYNLQ
jgi:hypothetical protein